MAVDSVSVTSSESLEFREDVVSGSELSVDEVKMGWDVLARSGEAGGGKEVVRALGTVTPRRGVLRFGGSAQATERSGWAATKALKEGSCLESGIFQGNRRSTMQRNMIATLQTSDLRGS